MIDQSVVSESAALRGSLSSWERALPMGPTNGIGRIIGLVCRMLNGRRTVAASRAEIPGLMKRSRKRRSTFHSLGLK